MKFSYDEVIFVTGSPRSSTTFIGQVIEKNTISSLVYEPFNYVSGDQRLSQFLPSASKRNIELANEIFNDVLRKKNSTQRVPFVTEDNWSRRIIKTFIGSRTRLTTRLAKLSKKKTLIVKDPTICRLIPYLDITIPHKIVYCKRPIVAIASSFLRLHWRDEVLYKEALRKWMADLKFDTLEHLDYTNIRHEILIGAFSEYESRLAYQSVCNKPNVFQFDHSSYILESDFYLKEFMQSLGIDITKLPKRVKTNKDAVPRGHAHNQNRDFQKSNLYYQELLSETEILFCKRIEKIAPT